MTYPGAMYGTFTDVYSSITALPNGMVAGQEEYDANNGKRYKLMIAGGTIQANKSVKRDPAVTTQQVIATAAATDGFEGVNMTGVTVTVGQVFWIQIDGDTTVLMAAGVAAGAIVAPSGTSGTLDAGSAAAVQHLRCVALAASGGGGATAAQLY